MTLDRFNSEIEDSLKHGGLAKDNLNFGSLLCWNSERRLSVIAKYSPPKIFSMLNRDLSVTRCTSDENTEFYYGVSPLLDSQLIIRAISELRFTDCESLNAFIGEHSNYFMLHTDNEEYLPSFAKYALLAVASNYGLIFKKDERLERIRLALDLPASVWCEREEVYCIKGCPTKNLLSELDRYHYLVSGNMIEITDLGSGKCIREIYGCSNHIQLLNGDVFYSGVLLKPNQLSILQNSFENSDTFTACVHFEKSSYATVFTLDGNFLSHPLLDNAEKSKLSDFLYTDDNYKCKLIDELSNGPLSAEQRLHIVNKYLQESYGVNQIGVSANIMTNDGFLLLGKRGKNAIDKGMLYPSVNGNAEVADKNVSFYQYSVYEDFPTVRIHDTRLDFLGEVTREAYAELKLDLSKQDLSCLGITVTGNCPESDTKTEIYSPTARRMHFNILFEAEIDSSYIDTVNKGTRAAEAFENEKMLGIRVYCHKNRFSRCLYSVGSFFKDFLGYKDFIEAFLLIFLFVKSTVSHELITAFDFTEPISLIFALIIIALNIQNFVQITARYVRSKKYLIKIVLCKKHTDNQIASKIHKSLNKYLCHPVSYILIRLYIEAKLTAVSSDKT